MPRRRGHRDSQLGGWVIPLTQGETHVTREPDEVLSTVLGSCIAACVRDPVARVGGMNHFLLPEGDGRDRLASRYGVNAMELLINGILQLGGSRRRLEAKIFGGANVIPALSDIGRRNADFARNFLAAEGIVLIGEDVGGTAARRVRYWPESGRASRLVVANREVKRVTDEELSVLRHDREEPKSGGNDVEFF